VHDIAWTPDSGYLLVTVQLVSVSGGSATLAWGKPLG
jgi:hypothetical protein